MFDVRLSITGIQEAQAANNRLIAAVKPTGATGRAVKYGTVEASRVAQVLTHVDTDALRASHRMQYAGLQGRVYLDPSAQNPRSHALTSAYGPIEHARGGQHAFYQRVVDEHGQRILSEMARIVIQGVG
jgi:hypothetical protein